MLQPDNKTEDKLWCTGAMEIKQLRTFATVAELGSLAKASDRLRIAQPALSRQIKQLEHELRTDLFVRNGRGMILTEAGQLLRSKVGNIVRQIEQARDDVLSMSGNPFGLVVLGITPTVSSVLSARLARRAMQELPDIRLRIIESNGGHLVEWLHRNEMDMAIVYGPAKDLHLSAHPLGSDELMFVGPRASGLDSLEVVELEQVIEKPLIMPSHSNGLRSLAEKAAARCGKDLNIIVEADCFRVIVDIVKQGVGYTMLPPSSIRQEIEQGALEAVCISKPVIRRQLVLASSTERLSTLALQATEKLIRSEVDVLSREGVWTLGGQK